MESKDEARLPDEAGEGYLEVVEPGFLMKDFDAAIAGIARNCGGYTSVVYDAEELMNVCLDQGMSPQEAGGAIDNAFACCRTTSAPLVFQRMTPAEVRQLSFVAMSAEEHGDGHTDRPQPSE